ncbi:MAG: ABC transporter permease [Lachnospiraceae bacterium]|nr:ABC transporter permease [Lachnospiraceae bacterium]
MEKTILLAKSNFRKNRGTSIGLFFLMLMAAMLVGVSLLIFLDAYPTAAKEAKRLDAGDGYLWIGEELQGIDDEFIEDLLGADTERYEAGRCLGYSNVSLPFGNGNVVPGLVVYDSRAFETKMNRTEIITEDTSITEGYIYLPYQFFTSGGYDLGDVYTFELLGKKYSFDVRGFINTTYFGCNNAGNYEFVIDDESYEKLYERDGDTAETIIVSFDLKEDVNPGSFRIRVGNDVLSRNPGAIALAALLPDTLSSKTFLSLILAASFLTMTIIIVVVIVLMLSNSIANYIRENMKTIGALKAIGYTGRVIIGSLFALFVFMACVGSLVGAGLSYTLMPVMVKIIVGQMGVPYTVSFNPVCSIIPVIFVVAFTFFVTFLAAGKIRKIHPIVALREGVENHNFRRNHIRLDRSVLGLNISLALKSLFTNMKQNTITFFVTGLLMFVCVVALLMYENFSRNPKLGILTFEICGGVVAFDYETKEDALKYLEDREDASNIRRMIQLNINYNNEDRLVTYIFDDVSKMNNKEVCYKGRLPEYDNEIAVSGTFAKQYGYDIGDEVRFDYGEKNSSYLITGLVQTCNNFGKEAVMSEKAAEQLIDFEYIPGYFWFDCDDAKTSQKILDEATEKYGDHVVSAMNFFDTLEGNMTTFKDISTLMLVLLCSISAVVIMLILYLLIKAFIYNKRRDYGIYKAIGYTSGSLVLQTALSFMPSIVLAAVVFAFGSYYAANPYMSMIMRSFGLMKCNFDIPVPGVVMIAIGLVLIAFAFALVQSSKVRKIEAYRMLICE